MAIGKTNVGGGSGGTLTVTAPANVTVTVSKDGKTKTKNSGTSGVVVFKGLDSGVWNVAIADGTDTSAHTVMIYNDTSDYISFNAYCGINPGAGLNFSVYGYESEEKLLSDTKGENTIGIITDTAITSWVFSADAPESPAEGLVWIKTGLSSAVAFNALKKNGLRVCPIQAKQRLSGAWANKTAKSFLGGAWTDWWDGSTLYDSGDEIEPTTGGWSAQAFKASNDVGDPKAPTVTKNAENMKVELAGYSGGKYYCGCLMTNNAVDLTGFTTIKFNITAITSRVYLRVASAHSNSYTSEASLQISKNGEYALDISSITGGKYIAIAISQANASVTFDKIWLE